MSDPKPYTLFTRKTKSGKRVWYYYLRVGDGRRLRRSTGTTSRKLAEQYAQKHADIDIFFEGALPKLVELGERIEHLETLLAGIEIRFMPFERRERAESKKGYIYFIINRESENGTHLVKIGKSIGKKRAQGFPLPFKTRILYQPVEDRHDAEIRWHTTFFNKYVKREWFALTDDDLEYIKEYAEEIT